MTRLIDERPELAGLVRAAREVYLEAPPVAVRERHEAMIAAELRRLAAAPARRVRFRRRSRFGLAVALAVALVAVVVVRGSDGQPAPTAPSDRHAASPPSERAGSFPRQLPPAQETERRRRRAPDTRSAPAPSVPEPDPRPAPAPEPRAPAERPPVVVPEPTPQRGYGGPDRSREPLKGPLDTEPPITATPESGAPAPDVPDP